MLRDDSFLVPSMVASDVLAARWMAASRAALQAREQLSDLLHSLLFFSLLSLVSTYLFVIQLLVHHIVLGDPLPNTISVSTMLSAFLRSFVLLIAQRSIQSLFRCSCSIVEHLHVHQDHDLAIGQIEADPPKEERSEDDPPPADVDMFENPSFVSTEYKDDRAAVNLANVASHANTQAHPKNRGCKPCRGRRPAFSKRRTGRRDGYQRGLSLTRTAVVPLNAWPHLVPTPSIQAQDPIAHLRASTFLGARQEVSRLRGGDFKILNAGSNRFAPLHVERTKDEDDYQDDIEECQRHDLDENSSNHIVQPPMEILNSRPVEPSTSHPLAQLVAFLDSETDSDADEGSTDDAASDESSTTPVVPSTIHTKSIISPAGSASERVQPHAPRSHEINDTDSELATDGGSDTTYDNSTEMPWEEDDWAERKLLGIRLLSWTRTRVQLMYKQGGGEVQYFVGREML